MSQAGVIDGLQFARKAEVRQGRLDLPDLPRLAEMRCSTEGLYYRVSGAMNARGKPCLRVGISGLLQLVCQRCVGPLPHHVAVEVELVLSEDLREIEEADDDMDRVLATRRMDLGQLVEDEVILSLPMVPRHENCVRVAVAGREARESPFGVLANWRRGG